MKSRISEKFQAMQQRAGETARNVSRTSDEYAHEHPWTIVAIVGAAALLLGLIFGGTRRD